MKKKRIKSKNKDIGFISSNGICIDGDILINCEHEHNSGSFLWFQILLTFVTTICTAFMAVSFLDMEIYKTTIIYYSAMLSLVFGLTETTDFIARSKGARPYPWRVLAVTEKDTDMHCPWAKKGDDTSCNLPCEQDIYNKIRLVRCYRQISFKGKST